MSALVCVAVLLPVYLHASAPVLHLNCTALCVVSFNRMWLPFNDVHWRDCL